MKLIAHEVFAGTVVATDNISVPSGFQLPDDPNEPLVHVVDRERRVVMTVIDPVSPVIVTVAPDPPDVRS